MTATFSVRHDQMEVPINPSSFGSTQQYTTKIVYTIGVTTVLRLDVQRAKHNPNAE